MFEWINVIENKLILYYKLKTLSNGSCNFYNLKYKSVWFYLYFCPFMKISVAKNKANWD